MEDVQWVARAVHILTDACQFLQGRCVGPCAGLLRYFLWSTCTGTYEGVHQQAVLWL